MAATQNGPELHPTTVELARGANYGAIGTTMPDGNLQNHIIWVHTDGERLFVNTEVHRQKYKNVQRDPKVTLTIRDEEVVEMVTGPEARGHIDELSQKYHGQDYDPDDVKTERVTPWIVSNRQTLVGPGADEGDPSSR